MKAAAIVQAFIERINAHDVDGIVTAISSDHRFVDSLGAVFTGREALRQGWQAYFALVAEYRIAVREVVETLSAVLVVGDAAGRTEGIDWTVPAAWRAVVRKGQVTEWQVYADNEPLRAALQGRPPLRLGCLTAAWSCNARPDG